MNQTESAASAVVPAIGTGGSLGTVRSLGRSGVNVIAVSEQETPPSFSSKYCDEHWPVPAPTDDLEGYRDALLGLARRDDVESIVPVREPDIHVLSKNRSAFAEHIGTPWPTFDRLTAVHDRNKLFEAAIRADVSVPETAPLDEIEDWDRERIVKGRYAILTSDNVDIPASKCGEPPKTIFLDPGVEPDVESIVDAMGHVPITQDYVPGTEFCLRAIYDDGEAVVTSQKKLIRGYKYYRGPSVYHEAVDIPRLEEAGLRLLDELDWQGIASVGFIRDESGAFNLLEINPRFPASLPVDIHAGIDYPRYYWQLSTGEPIDETPEYRRGTSSHLLRGEAVHMHSVLREESPLAVRPSALKTGWNIATSLVQHPNFDCFSLDDPAPFVRDALNMGRSLVSGE